MNSSFKSIDETLASIRNDHESTIQTFKDRIVALELELTLHKDLSTRATKDRDQWMRLATKLVTQFGTVEQVFAEAKAMALAIEHDEKLSQQHDSAAEEKSAAQKALDAAEHTFETGPSNG